MTLLELPTEALEVLRRPLGPLFANAQQRSFFDSQVGELLYSGAFGAGKSRILCEKALALGKRYPGAPIGIFRKVAASLAATTKMTFLRDVVKPGDIARSNKTEGWYELGNGSRFWFLGLDADTNTGVPSKVGSLDLAFAFVDEAVELTEADWMMLLGRLRFNGVPFHQIGAATNPADPAHWLKRRFDEPSQDRLMVHAPTSANTMLPADYRARMEALTGLYHARYVAGDWVSVAGALWSSDMIRYRSIPESPWGKDLVSCVVAIDPAVTSNSGSDETGIVVVGKGADGNVYVVADLSCRMPPAGWARRAVDAYRTFEADRIVAEVNNGGDMVESVIRAVDAGVPYRAVRASRGKRMRAEPVQALYVKSPAREAMVFHAERFAELENQMVGYDPDGAVSPDRLDALVWGITDLVLSGTGWGGNAVSAIA